MRKTFWIPGLLTAVFLSAGSGLAQAGRVPTVRTSGFNSAGAIGSQYKWKHGLDIELFRKSAFPFKGIPNADASGFHMNQHFIGANGRDGKLLSF